ncbi:unnamed protein product, partial [Polarella glacialis]
VTRSVFSSILAALPTLIGFVGNPRVCDGAVAIELLACALKLLQAVPISRGRYAFDLMPLTHVVIHQVFLKALVDPLQFSNASRYWRLSALALRWLRLVLRGPMPLSSSPALNAVLVGPYADSDMVASEVAMGCTAGNATAYAFQCLLSLDSPLFARTLYLTLLRGCGMDGLAERRRGGAARPFMEQSVRVGLDVVRLLLQRDVFFCRLHGQQASERAAAGSGGNGFEDGTLLFAEKLLLTEFPFAYPPPAVDGGSSSADSFAGNPFCSQRRQSPAPDATEFALIAGGRRPNPTYLAILAEFIGARSSHAIPRLALFNFTQCALREPSRVLRILQLEPWRLQAMCINLHDRIVQPEEDSEMAEASEAIGSSGRSWDAQREAQFTFE